MRLNKIDATMTRTPATYVPILSAFAGFDESFPRTNKMPMMDAMMPTAESSSGKSAAVVSVKFAPLGAVCTATAASVIAEMIEPTYDSNKSDPMPATSPTLSPTLSAITAGFRGSSSGIPASTLSTKSAPTSAAFV